MHSTTQVQYLTIKLRRQYNLIKSNIEFKWVYRSPLKKVENPDFQNKLSNYRSCTACTCRGISIGQQNAVLLCYVCRSNAFAAAAYVFHYGRSCTPLLQCSGYVYWHSKPSNQLSCRVMTTIADMHHECHASVD